MYALSGRCLAALTCGMTCQRHSNRLLTCWFYKLYPDWSVLFQAPVTGLLQCLKCKESKHSKPFILLKLCRQWVKCCGITLVNLDPFCGFVLCLQSKYYLLKDSASGFHSWYLSHNWTFGKKLKNGLAPKIICREMYHLQVCKMRLYL